MVEEDMNLGGSVEVELSGENHDQQVRLNWDGFWKGDKDAMNETK